jgi:hypothetical protein
MIRALSTCLVKCATLEARPERQILEQICAHNSDRFFNYRVVSIPRADKPDF